MAIDDTMMQTVFTDIMKCLGKSITYTPSGGSGTAYEADYQIHSETDKVEGAMGDVTVWLKKTDISSIAKADTITIGSKSYNKLVVVSNDWYNWEVVGYDTDVT